MIDRRRFLTISLGAGAAASIPLSPAVEQALAAPSLPYATVTFRDAAGGIFYRCVAALVREGDAITLDLITSYKTGIVYSIEVDLGGGGSMVHREKVILINGCDLRMKFQVTPL